MIEYCLIRNNDAYHKGGGIQLENNANPVIRYCTIIDNIADFGGGISCYGTDPEIVNCTIYNNEALYGGGVCCLSNAAPTIKNTIFAGTISGYGIYSMSSPNVSITYSDFFDNQNGHCAGNVPVGFGIFTGVNANGDSCDTYHNIFLDPMFVDPTSLDFNLLEDSPCIDAGDPVSPPDPDGTVTDIGAFYFDQGTVSPVTVTLTPYSPPIVIPAVGGSFDFNIEVANAGMGPETFDIWTMVTLPNGSEYGPIINVPSFTAPAGWSANRDRIQAVPGGAPAGMYTYDAYVGDYPDDIWNEDHFDFEKLADGDGGAYFNSWECWGEGFKDYAVAISSCPSVSTSLKVYPNPFNPQTQLTYALPEAEHVSLVIYDIRSSIVARLVDRGSPAGDYTVVFDGSGCPSGVYFARLTAGSVQQTQKLLLLK